LVEITRKQVIPGDVIVTGDYRPGMFVQRRGSDMVALRVGLAEIARNDVKVIPLSGAYMPRTEDQVVGKVVNVTGYGWEADINSCFVGYLPGQFVFGRDFSPATHDLTARFTVGDLLLAKIEAFDRSRDPQLSIRGPGLGKIPRGDLVKISPMKVPRLIGRKGYMINMIAELTNCEIKVGQNGIVVLDGPPEGVARATQAIQLIEEGAHMADLTTKVQQLLGSSSSSGDGGASTSSIGTAPSGSAAPAAAADVPKTTATSEDAGGSSDATSSSPASSPSSPPPAPSTSEQAAAPITNAEGK
jgi:exosome complex component RRP4